MPWLLVLKVAGGLGAAVGAFGAAYWLATQLMSLGEVKQQLVQNEAAYNRAVEINESLRLDVQTLADAISKREVTQTGIRTAIRQLTDAAKEVSNVCDPEPLDPHYVEQLRRAADIATTGGMPMSRGPRGVDGTDAPTE